MNTAGATDGLCHTISALKKHGFLCFFNFSNQASSDPKNFLNLFEGSGSSDRM
jgi:hypothetical protein